MLVTNPRCGFSVGRILYRELCTRITTTVNDFFFLAWFKFSLHLPHTHVRMHPDVWLSFHNFVCLFFGMWVCGIIYQFSVLRLLFILLNTLVRVLLHFFLLSTFSICSVFLLLKNMCIYFVCGCKLCSSTGYIYIAKRLIISMLELCEKKPAWVEIFRESDHVFWLI